MRRSCYWKPPPAWDRGLQERDDLSLLSVQPVSTRATPLRLLVVSQSGDSPPIVRELVETYGVEVVCVRTVREAREPALLASADAVLLCDPPENHDSVAAASELQLLGETLVSHGRVGVVLSPGTTGVGPGDDGALMRLSNPCSVEELWGRLAAVAHCRPILRQLEEQVASMQRFGKKLNQRFVEVDQELRLASRLQRGFLPRTLPEIGDIRFTALFRPATWVSGDLYDVRRLDETHLGFYLADAVGHGVAAGLLTMFIKQAIVGKQVSNHHHHIIPPSQVLAALNTELANQELPHCQFVTACYGTINVETHVVAFARAGHPHPIHVGADGRCVEVRTIGGLLGVFDGETFPSVSLALEPGEKLFLYSDGLEDVIVARRPRDQGEVHFTPAFLEAIREPGPACLDALTARLDRAEGSLSPADDQTCLVIERL